MKLIFNKHTKAIRKLQLIMEFSQGTKRDLEKSHILGLGGSCTAFDNVGRNRNGRSSELRRQSINLLFRKGLSDLIDAHSNCICQLKCPKLSMIPHDSFAIPFRAFFATLKPTSFSLPPIA
jgi:hypothetical protein